MPKREPTELTFTRRIQICFRPRHYSEPAIVRVTSLELGEESIASWDILNGFKVLNSHWWRALTDTERSQVMKACMAAWED